MGRAGIIVGAGVALVVAVILAAVRVGEVPGALSGWQALVLGIVQGLTELLPISSSGHLIFVPWVLEWHYLDEHPDFNKTFDVALHFGTMIAVAAYFWREIWRLTTGFLRSIARRSIRTAEERLAWLVAIATIPAAVVGALGESFIEDHLGQPWQIAILLAAFAVILYVADRTPERRGMHDLTWRAALGIGVAQALALAPGVSRSGISISAARFLGLDRDSAARFSFLLLVPVVFGASVLRGVQDVVLEGLPPGSGGPFVVGMIASAATGFLAIVWLLGYVRRHDYSVFVVYRLLLAAAALLLVAAGVREATF